MAVMPISQIEALPIGSPERKAAVVAYATKGAEVSARDKLTAAWSAYRGILFIPGANNAVAMLKSADALASRERAARLTDLPKTPSAPKPSLADKSGYEKDTAVTAPPPAPQKQESGLMASIKGTLGPQGPLILAGAGAVVLMLLLIPKKK